MAGPVTPIDVVPPYRSFRYSRRPIGRAWAVCKPNHVDGRGRSEERPSFDGLCPAMTENDMEVSD
jgi:hypothetical protein